MLFAILAALFVGILSQFWALISIPYRLGALHEMSRVPIVYGAEPWTATTELVNTSTCSGLLGVRIYRNWLTYSRFSLC